MIPTCVLILVALFLLLSCSTLGPFNKGSTNKTPFRGPPASALFADTQPLTQTHSPFLLFAIVLAALIQYARSRRSPGPHRRIYRLNDQEIALLGLASDTMQDLWRRLQAKPRCNIIPFRGD